MTTTEQAIEVLLATGKHRVIRLLGERELHKGEQRQVTCVIVDSEATSADPLTACPVELGMLKVAFNPGDLSSIVATDSLSMLNDPGVPSEPGAEAVHGITAEQLAGQHFDLDAIAQFLVGVDFIIAHNAGYDRPVLTRSIPFLADFQWACSMSEIDWKGLGISSRSLDYLAYKAGFYFSAHRAVADCEALLEVLSFPFADTGPSIFRLNETRAGKTWTLLCTGAKFELREAMKQRRYRWNPGDTGDVPEKCWTTPELKTRRELLAEMIWISENIFTGADANISAICLDSKTRYAEGGRRAAFTQKRTLNIHQTITKIQSMNADQQSSAAG